MTATKSLPSDIPTETLKRALLAITPAQGAWIWEAQGEKFRVENGHVRALETTQTEENTMNTIAVTTQPGTISHGTMRPEDLVPRFLATLIALRCEDGEIARIQEALDANPDAYYESSACIPDLEWLFDKLNEYAPEHHHFGAHKGDGSDYGFWRYDLDPVDCDLTATAEGVITVYDHNDNMLAQLGTPVWDDRDQRYERDLSHHALNADDSPVFTDDEILDVIRELDPSAISEDDIIV